MNQKPDNGVGQRIKHSWLELEKGWTMHGSGLCYLFTTNFLSPPQDRIPLLIYHCVTRQQAKHRRWRQTTTTSWLLGVERWFPSYCPMDSGMLCYLASIYWLAFHLKQFFYEYQRQVAKCVTSETLSIWWTRAGMKATHIRRHSGSEINMAYHASCAWNLLLTCTAHEAAVNWWKISVYRVLHTEVWN